MDNPLDKPLIETKIKLKTTAYLFKYWFLILLCVLFFGIALFLLYECYSKNVDLSCYDYPIYMIIVCACNFYIAQTYKVEYQEDTIS